MEELVQKGMNFLMDVLYVNVPKILVALLVLWLGLKLIKLLSKFMGNLFDKKQVDPSLKGFLISITEIALKLLLGITVLGMIGIEVTSFIAVLGAAGLAVGMALQGTLQNFAGGVIILILKPYKVGDVIEQGGVCGCVSSIQIFNTVLITPDNKVIIMPNTQLATGSLINYTRAENRRVDVNVGIAYGESVDKARQVLVELANARAEVLKDEALAPVAVVTSLSDSSVDLQLRVWVKTDDYWTAFLGLNEEVYAKFKEEGIEIPFKQVQVHMSKD